MPVDAVASRARVVRLDGRTSRESTPQRRAARVEHDPAIARTMIPIIGCPPSRCYSPLGQIGVVLGLSDYVNRRIEYPPSSTTGTAGGDLDVERESDVPISTQIFWQLAYQIDSGRLLPGARLPPVRELVAHSE